MRIIRKIMVFDKGGYFLFMLKGYCYANNIQMAEVEFSIEGINEVQSFNPALIFVPLDLISYLENNNTESGLLKLICKKKEIKICALKNGPSRKDSEDLSEWIDMFIDNPIDIVEIDRVLKTVFPSNDYLSERRTNKDRRIISDRRQCPINKAAYMASRGIEAQYSNRRPHDGVYEVQDFNIDSRNKCLVLHGRRIYLTPKEFDLIEYLSTDFNRIFSPDKIISHLWQENHKATKSDLYQHIHLLRKKIEKDHSQPQLILNVKGFGYKLNILNSHDPCASCVHYEKLQEV